MDGKDRLIEFQITEADEREELTRILSLILYIHFFSFELVYLEIDSLAKFTNFGRTHWMTLELALRLKKLL